MKLKYLAILFAIIFNQAQATSFDCTKAKTSVEKAICGNFELSNLDEELARKYKVAIQEHPLPDYIRSRQRDWLSLNAYCDRSKFLTCLIDNYKERIKQLSDINKIKVYSNSNKFSFVAGDAVAEVRSEGINYSIDLWGGARVHREASRQNGKTTFTLCEFQGSFSSPNGGKAVDKNGNTFSFEIAGKKLTYEENGGASCPGFASLPDDMNLIENKL
jgi:uncharacterized protein